MPASLKQSNVDAIAKPLYVDDDCAFDPPCLKLTRFDCLARFVRISF